MAAAESLNPNAEPFTLSFCKPICHRPRSFYPQPPLALPPPPPEFRCCSVFSLYRYPTPYYMCQYNAELQPQPYYKPTSLPYYQLSGGVVEALVGDEDKDCLVGRKEKVDVEAKKEFRRRCGRSTRGSFLSNRTAWVPKKSEPKQGVKSGVESASDNKGLEFILRGKTSVMIRNIPNKLSRENLVELLDKYCRVNSNEDYTFHSEYDFVYLPVDFKSKGNKGYAFVNFTSCDGAMRVCKYFVDYEWNEYETKKVCKISRAKTQGKEALVRRFQNRNFTCDTDDYLPIVFFPPRNGLAPCTPPKIVGQRGAFPA